MKRKILIVDDNSSQINFLATVAKRCFPDGEFYFAENVSAALSIVHTIPDLTIAVIDLFLTEPPLHKEGLEILRELERSCPSCYRILVSEKADDRALAHEEKLLYHAFVGFKPRDEGKNTSAYQQMQLPITRLAGILQEGEAAVERMSGSLAVD